MVLMQAGFENKIINTAQVGGIETAVLDNGAERGNRIAWFNTGTGLRFKVVLDRAMDIADTFYNQHSMAWLSHGGFTAPQPFSNQGLDWLKTFGGGLLTTCGLSHIGGPETDENGQRGLHDQVSNIAANIESIIQPDPLRGKMEMSITGTMKQSQVLGPNLELRRTISATLGKPVIRINDEVINRGNTEAPLMMLYHFNFGWPLVDEGTEIIWKGKWVAREQGEACKIFREGNQFKKCLAPGEDHNGRGEEAVFIDAEPNLNGQCLGGLYNANLGIALSIRFKKEQLPWLTNWQHWGKGEYVTGIEPGTNRVIGQAKARAQNELIFLQPGETRNYDLEIEITEDLETIATLLKNQQD